VVKWNEVQYKDTASEETTGILCLTKCSFKILPPPGQPENVVYRVVRSLEIVEMIPRCFVRSELESFPM